MENEIEDNLRRSTTAVLEEIFGSSSDDPRSSGDDEEVTLSQNMQFQNIEGFQSSGDDEEVTLSQGMQFQNIEGLFDVYKDYAKKKGFGIAKRTSKKENGVEKYVTICCDKARKSVAQHTSKRENCPARVNAILQNDFTWKISKVVYNHNHDMDPSMSRLMIVHRNLSQSTKRRIEANDISGIKPSKTVKMLEVQAGGPENMECLPIDCRNFIHKNRRSKLASGDAECIHQLFLKMQQVDREFFYSIDVDDEEKLKNVLWVHTRSRAAYKEFHDVISFDTTYLVNRYRMPFATIIGVNHHGQSILLGCALISHEDIVTFKWLFQTWLAAMDDVHPNCIITDQCESIKSALREVMPDTRHRFCLWHILGKLPEKFKGVVDYQCATKEFKELIYQSLEIRAFENNWQQFVGKYGLQEHDWLAKLYTERENWIPVYLNHLFWAGMVSTQRSEGMHAFFDGYVSSSSTLKQFVEQYEIAISNKFQKEFVADFQSKNKVFHCSSHFPWEKQYQMTFTHSIFKKVQDQIKLMLYCEQHGDPDFTQLGVEIYKIIQRMLYGGHDQREIIYTVEYRPDGQYYNCNCKKFESKGILCCHILKLLAIKNINMINERYIMRRWRKDVFRPHSKLFLIGGYPQMTNEFKNFDVLQHLLEETFDLTNNNMQKIHFIKEGLEAMQRDLKNWDDGVHANAIYESGEIIEQNRVHILDPPLMRGRGRPPINRRRSRFEEIRRRGRGRRGDRGNGRRGRSNRGRNLDNDIIEDTSRM